MAVLLAVGHISQSHVDVAARTIAIISLVVSVAALALTWYLWHRSGPRLAVTCFVKADTGTIRINVANNGRLSATVRSVELRDRLVIQSGSSSQVINRWAISAEPTGDPLPRSIEPTNFLEVDIDAKEALARAAGAQAVTVQAFIQRGDNKWLYSKPVKIRSRRAGLRQAHSITSLEDRWHGIRAIQ